MSWLVLRKRILNYMGDNNPFAGERDSKYRDIKYSACVYK
jgi:hypothetical protein